MESAQLAEKDCRSYRLRRIRCDRTMPHCIKCIKKSCPCPGYGPRIRWTNSVASCGRFKGLSVPDLTLASPPQCDSPDSPSPETGQSQHITSMAELLPEPVLNQLMQYYTTEIAPINVWVDSQYNEYKRLVIPLAKTQPVLRLAIIGIAAAHKPYHIEPGVEISHSACEEAVALITERIRKLASMEIEEIHEHINNDAGIPEAVIAATLVLCNYSLLESNISLALFHLQAARVLVNTLTSKKTSNDDLFVFLRNQVACIDVLACTTLFSSSHIPEAILPELGHGPVIFGHYLKIIHGITIRSMQRLNGVSDDCYEFILSLQDSFELARGSTLMAAGRLTDLSSDSYQRDVIRLAQAFHHTAIIYACKRAGDPRTMELERDHVKKLFATFQKFEDLKASAANLSWPIFIGGICSCDNQEQMDTIRRLCQTLVENSPFKYYANIPIFLEELWGSSHSDWILIAREWEDKGTPVLAA